MWFLVFPFRIFFTPLEVSFSSFLHSTYTLLNNLTYLKFEDGTPVFIQINFRITLSIFLILLYHRTFTFFGSMFSTYFKVIQKEKYTPQTLNFRFNFARHYFRNLDWFFLPLTCKMFHFIKCLVLSVISSRKLWLHCTKFSQP